MAKAQARNFNQLHRLWFLRAQCRAATRVPSENGSQNSRSRREEIQICKKQRHGANEPQSHPKSATFEKSLQDVHNQCDTIKSRRGVHWQTLILGKSSEI